MDGQILRVSQRNSYMLWARNANTLSAYQRRKKLDENKLSVNSVSMLLTKLFFSIAMNISNQIGILMTNQIFALILKCHTSCRRRAICAKWLLSF